MEKLKVVVTVQQPSASGQRASTWIVVTPDDKQVRYAPEAEVPNDPRGVHAVHQGRLWVQARAKMAGENVEIEDIPAEVWWLGAGGTRTAVAP